MSCFDPCALYPELLFALDGYAGDIFVSDADPKEQPSPSHVSLALSPDVAVDDTPTRCARCFICSDMSIRLAGRLSTAWPSWASIAAACTPLSSSTRGDTQAAATSVHSHAACRVRSAALLGVARCRTRYHRHRAARRLSASRAAAPTRHPRRPDRLPLNHAALFVRLPGSSSSSLFTYCTHLELHYHPPQMVLPALHHTVYDVQQKRLDSASTLQLLYSKVRWGCAEAVKTPSMLRSCHIVVVWGPGAAIVLQAPALALQHRALPTPHSLVRVHSAQHRAMLWDGVSLWQGPRSASPYKHATEPSLQDCPWRLAGQW